jgi:hypothetical protein
MTAKVRRLYPTPDPAQLAAADAAVRAVLRTQYGTDIPAMVVVQAVAGSGLVETTRRVIIDRAEEGRRRRQHRRSVLSTDRQVCAWRALS